MHIYYIVIYCCVDGPKALGVCVNLVSFLMPQQRTLHDTKKNIMGVKGKILIINKTPSQCTVHMNDSFQVLNPCLVE